MFSDPRSSLLLFTNVGAVECSSVSSGFLEVSSAGRTASAGLQSYAVGPFAALRVERYDDACAVLPETSATVGGLQRPRR